eukprot:g10354.t1
MYAQQWTDRQKQRAPPKKRRLVTYTMQPLSEQPGHRFGVNRILRLGQGSLFSAGRDGVVRRWDVSAMLAPTKGARGTGDGDEEEGERAGAGAGAGQPDESGGSGHGDANDNDDDDDEKDGPPQYRRPQPPCTGFFASHTDWVTGLAVAEDRIMASASYDGTLKLWDLASADRAGSVAVAGTAGARGRGGEGGGANGACTAARACTNTTTNTNKTTTSAAGSHEYRARPPRPNPLATVAGHGDYVKCLAYAQQGGVLVSGGLDKRILLWDLQRMSAPLMTLRSGAAAGGAGGRGSGCVSDADWGSIGGVGAGGGAGRITNNAMMMDADYSQAAGSGSGSGSDSRSGPGAATAAAYDEEGSAWDRVRDPSRVVLRPGHAATGPNEVLELCRQNKGSVHCVDAAEDASLVASGGTDCMIRLLDPRAGGGGHAAKICKLDGHRDNVRCVKIDEGGTRVVSGSSDGTIRVWDVRQQCCLGVYELPGGSVWAMQPSPCDFDVYYSGGRGRRVYRTDFRTGESTLVCVTDSEVLDMAFETVDGGREGSLSMWLSSTQSHIALWGGAGGGGAALRSGRPSATASASVTADGDTGTDSVAAEAYMDAFDVTPAYTDEAEEGGGGGETGGGEMMGLDDGGCLLDAPVGIIRGQPGVTRHIILNNRRHVLTEDDARPQPNVALWDVTKARQIEVYPAGTVLEDKERSLLEIIAVRPWFTVDTHLGTPLVSLSESTVFDGELYAVDARGERQTFLASPPPSPPAASTPTDATWDTTEASPPAPSSSSSSSTTLASARGGGTGADAARGRGGSRAKVEDGATTTNITTTAGQPPARASKARSVQDEVKVNLGDAVLRGLFSRWVDQYLRLHGDGGAGALFSTSRRRDNGGGSTYSSGESDEDSENDGDYESSRSASTRSAQSSQASPGPRDGSHRRGSGESGGAGGAGFRGSHVLDVELAGGGGGGRAIRDDTMLWVTESDVGGGIQRTLLQKRVGEFDGREGQDVIPHWAMTCVLHGEFRAKEQPKVAFFLAPWIPPERSSLPPPSTPQKQQQQGKRGGEAGDGSGRPASLPASRGGGTAAAAVAGGKAGGAAGAGGVPSSQVSQRFTAPAQMLVSKVMAYVLSHDDLRQHLESTVVHPDGGDGSDDGSGTGANGAAGVAGGAASPSRETPEDLVEVLCGDRVVEPHLYIGAVQQYIWNPKESGTLFLHYRSRRRQRPMGPAGRYPQLRKLSFTLVLFLAISDIGADVTYFMGNPEDNRAACVTQGALQQFFQMAQILWTVAIACVLHDVTVNLRMYRPHEQRALMRRFHLAVWGVALFSALLPFTTGSYGSTGSWCWIEQTNPRAGFDVGTMWRYLVLYCPLWAAIVFNIVAYVRIVGVVRRFSAEIGGGGGADGGAAVGPSAEQAVRMTKFVNRLVWYPVVLVASWTFATINRIQNAVNPDHPVFGLFLLHTSLVAFQGIFNALVYGSTDAVKSAVAQELIVERCLKASGAGRGGGAGAGAAAGDGPTARLDPEDEEDGSSGVELRHNDDSLGGFDDLERNNTSGGGGARVSGGVADIPLDDNDDVEVYNASKGQW